MPDDTLFVKKGSYTPTAKTVNGPPPTDPRDATYLLPNEITIYGGFAGTETSPEGRDMTLIATTNATIIEGDIGTMRTAMAANNTDNIKQLLTTYGTITLDGLTVARGYNQNRDRLQYLYASFFRPQLTLRHCRFIDNTSPRTAGLFFPQRKEGNTIFVLRRITITSSTFERNTGAVSLLGGLCRRYRQ